MIPPNKPSTVLLGLMYVKIFFLPISFPEKYEKVSKTIIEKIKYEKNKKS